MSHQDLSPLRCLLFTFQNLSPSTRKTGMTFIAEALAKMGHDTGVVTVQLSWLSRLGGAARLRPLQGEQFNAWVERQPNLRSFLWLPLVHPTGNESRLGRVAGTLLSWIYPYLLPAAILSEVARADLIVIESCAAVALFDRLKKFAPHARFVYCASDRLDLVGMHSSLSRILDKTADRYDLIRVPAQAMCGDFSPQAKVAVVPHGLEKTAFDAAVTSPYFEGTTNAVVGGDMNSDLAALNYLVEQHPDVNFHVFGKLTIEDIGNQPNLTFHGEVGFATLVPFLKHADVGLAPYVERPRAEYLVQSSLKILQYTYCKLPIVAPAFVKAGRDHICDYEPGRPDTIRHAMKKAIAYRRDEISTESIGTWSQVVNKIIQLVGLDSKPNGEKISQVSLR